jgi:pimeloyl-ACP methyl ester carboxylesterase
VVRGIGMLVIFVLAIASCGGLAAVGIAGQEVTRSEAGLKGTIPAAWSSASKGLPAGTGAIRFQPLGLFMVRPYVAGKVPVVFVHGLWGSPRNWARIIGALEADPFLSERYQFLTFGYSGGSSM